MFFQEFNTQFMAHAEGMHVTGERSTIINWRHLMDCQMNTVVCIQTPIVRNKYSAGISDPPVVFAGYLLNALIALFVQYSCHLHHQHFQFLQVIYLFSALVDGCVHFERHRKRLHSRSVANAKSVGHVGTYINIRGMVRNRAHRLAQGEKMWMNIREFPKTAKLKIPS